MKILRSIGAVVAGFLACAVLSIVTDFIMEAVGWFPPLDEPQRTTVTMLMAALAYRTVYTVVGGYVTAVLAPSRPVAHAVALGVLGMVVGTLGAVAMWKIGNNWYPVALVVEAVPCTWLGAWFYMSRKAVQPA